MSLRRERAGVFVSEWGDFTEMRAQWAWAAGFRWIAAQGHAGGSAPPVAHPPPAIIQRWRQQGFDVGCWGAFGEDTDPIAAARAANGIILNRGYSFYVANIEIPFNERAFIDEFRRLLPRFTIWLSSEITGRTESRDWGLWFNGRGATCWQPQCYLNANPQATPIQAMFWAIRPKPPGYGIPRSMVKPTIGLYGQPRVPIGKYIDELSAMGPPTYAAGFSIWLGETAEQDEYAALGHAIRTRGIAKLD